MKHPEIAHLVVEIVKQERLIGGIFSSALINRVQAAYAAEHKQPPAGDDIRITILDLLAADVIHVSASKRVTLVSNAKAEKPKKAQFENTSGIWPIGPNDYLFNSDGEPVAQVTMLARMHGAVRLEVVALFHTWTALDGSTVPGSGEVIGPKPSKPKIMLGEWDVI